MGLTWSQRAEKAGGLPNLGLGGTLVAATSTSYFAAKASGVLAIIITHGWHAYFVSGLRVTSWKHGIMSNGEPVGFPGDLILGLGSFILWMLCIGAIEFIAGIVHAIFKDRGRWTIATAKFIAGILLISLSLWFYSTGKFIGIHPVPFAPLIGGIVLLCKGVASPFRQTGQKNTAQARPK